mmetsp:Transcript_45092/g.105812  ORF Transcript_45092/g.105812 Transcript_45092/m.105812 type:complete len:111 (+) Transcript_45092:1422-1754(+)
MLLLALNPRQYLPLPLLLQLQEEEEEQRRRRRGTARRRRRSEEERRRGQAAERCRAERTEGRAHKDEQGGGVRLALEGGECRREGEQEWRAQGRAWAGCGRAAVGKRVMK